MSTCSVVAVSAPAPLVCVVDSDPALRRQVQALLRTLGARTAGYASAAEFLATLPTAVPSCLIVDSRLPDMPGLALLQELRARGLQVPTILLSDDADVTGAVAAMRAGALDFVEKPYIDRALVTQVAAILDLDGRRPH